MHFWSLTGVREKLEELFSIDRRSLALMRVLVALVVFIDLLQRARFLYDHYGLSSIYPPDVIWNGDQFTSWPIVFRLLEHLPHLPAYVILLGLPASICLLIGYKTRIASIVTWACVLLLQILNPIILQGGDVTLRLVLLLGMFLPWGLSYSVDSALSRRALPLRTTVLTPFTAAYLLQIGFIYLFAALEKRGVEWMSEGTAVYYALSIDQFTTPVGEFMLRFPLLLMFLTFSVLWLQRFAFFLLFLPVFTFPARLLAMTLLMLMHLSFAIHMNLGMFSWISIAALCGFLSPRFWDALEKYRKRYFSNLTIYYDGDCGFCRKSVYLIRTLLILPDTPIHTAQEFPNIRADMVKEDSWVIVSPDGSRHFGYDAGIEIARHSPLLFFAVPLLKLSWCRGIGERVYRYVADHRSRICLPQEPKQEKERPFLRVFGQITLLWLAVLYICFVFLWNYSNRFQNSFNFWFFNEHAKYLRMLGADQYWSIFSPYPMKDDGWYIIEGTTVRGQKVNLFDKDEPLHYLRPDNISEMYPNERWRKYMMNLSFAQFAQYRKYYTRYLCLRENKHEDVIQRVDMVYMMERTLPDYEPPQVMRIVLEWRECPLREEPPAL